jgi:hypothetical protein
VRAALLGGGGGGGGGSSFGISGLTNEKAATTAASVTISYTEPSAQISDFASVWPMLTL